MKEPLINLQFDGTRKMVLPAFEENIIAKNTMCLCKKEKLTDRYIGKHSIFGFLWKANVKVWIKVKVPVSFVEVDGMCISNQIV